MQVNLIGQKEVFESKKTDDESQAQDQDIRSVAHVRKKGLPKRKITCPFGVDEKIDHGHQQADSRNLKSHSDYGNRQYDPKAFSADWAQNLVGKKKRFHGKIMEPFLSLELRNIGSPDYGSCKTNENTDTNPSGSGKNADQMVSVPIAS